MNIAETKQVAPERIMQFAFGYAPTLIIEAAIRHRVFDVLDEAPKTVEQTAAATGASERGLRGIMNALVGFDFLAKDADGRYSLTPESAAFLVSGKPGYHGAFFRHTSEQILPNWMQLTEIVRTGKPATAVNQESDGAAFFTEFVEALFPLSYAAARMLGEELKISEIQTAISILDLAAGSGVWSIALAQQSPNARVTAVDWAGVIPTTRRMAERFGLADRYDFVEGDLLEAAFGASHTVATLGHILHSEGVERSKRLLEKTFDALAPGGTIAISEFLVNHDRTAPPQGLIFAVNMLVNTEAGDTFSFEEISEWLAECGFENPRLLEVPAPSPLILATKP